MNRIVGTPEYKLMTIRNWRTTTTVLGILDERAGRTTGSPLSPARSRQVGSVSGSAASR